MSSEYAPIVNYDMLISCPPSFSLSFSLPLRVVDFTDSTVEDCILECILEDGKSVHRLLMRPMFDRSRSFERPTKENLMMEQTYSKDGGNLERGTEFDLPTFGVAVLLATSITLTLVWLFCELFHLTKARRRGRRSSSNRGRSMTKRGGSNTPLSSPSSSKSCVQPRPQLSVAVRRTFTYARVIIRFIYAITFTFSVFTSLLSVALRQRIDNSVTTKSRQLTADFEEDSAVSSRSQIISCLAETSIHLNGAGLTSSRRFSAIAGFIVPSISTVQTAAAQWVEQTAARFLADVEFALTTQRRYAQKTSLNQWLLFPRALYNKTMELGNRRMSPIVANSTADDAFWNFLQVMPSEVELSVWTANIRERCASIHDVVGVRSVIHLVIGQNS